MPLIKVTLKSHFKYKVTLNNGGYELLKRRERVTKRLGTIHTLSTKKEGYELLKKEGTSYFKKEGTRYKKRRRIYESLSRTRALGFRQTSTVAAGSATVIGYPSVWIFKLHFAGQFKSCLVESNVRTGCSVGHNSQLL